MDIFWLSAWLNLKILSYNYSALSHYLNLLTATCFLWDDCRIFCMAYLQIHHYIYHWGTILESWSMSYNIFIYILSIWLHSSTTSINKHTIHFMPINSQFNKKSIDFSLRKALTYHMECKCEYFFPVDIQ